MPPRRGSKRSPAEETAGAEEETDVAALPSPKKSPAKSKKTKSVEGEEKGTTEGGESSAMHVESTAESSAASASMEKAPLGEKCSLCGAIEPRGFVVPEYIKRYEENAKSQGLDFKVIEEGRLIFLYRPKVGLHTVSKPDDIQRFYIAMEAMRTPIGEDARRVANALYHHHLHLLSKSHDHGDRESPREHRQTVSKMTDDKGRANELSSIEPMLYRVLTIPAKHLPKKDEKKGKFATVLSVSTDRNAIHEEMKERYYGTATRGSRFQDKARIVGEAFYMIVRETHNNKRLSKLVYVLENQEVTDPMKVFNIHKEGSFIMNVFNPERRNEGLDRAARPFEMASYPPYLQQLFEGLRKNKLKSIPLDPPSFLNYQHSMLLLFDASDRLHKDLHELLELAEKEEKLDLEAYVEETGEKDVTDKPLAELNATPDDLHVVGKKLE